MHVVASDIIADLRGVSLGLLLVGAALGLVLWLFGWKSHHFWVVLLATVGAGVYGLQEGAAYRAAPLVAALLLAVAAGVLALALVRLLAFGAGGLTGVIVLQAVAPGLDQPLVVFTISGLVSLMLFRWSLMALTSLTGAVVLCYVGLALLNLQGALDAVAWTDQAAPLVNWICLLLALMGFLFQFLMDRRAQRRAAAEEEEEGEGVLFRISQFYRRAG